MLKDLTPIQAKALDFISSTIQEVGAPPTLRELAAFMGYSSVGSAQDIVTALRKKGFLHTAEKNIARALVPAKHDHSRDFGNINNDSNTIAIPCLGAVPAGNPIEAIEERIGTLRMSLSSFSRPVPKLNEIFALRAQGDSMMGAGILDGDWLIVHVQKESPKQSIVVARVDGDVTVKRLMQDQKGWFLMPENPRFSDIRPKNDDGFEVVGRVIALQRTLL